MRGRGQRAIGSAISVARPSSSRCRPNSKIRSRLKSYSVADQLLEHRELARGQDRAELRLLRVQPFLAVEPADRLGLRLGLEVDRDAAHVVDQGQVGGEHRVQVQPVTVQRGQHPLGVGQCGRQGLRPGQRQGRRQPRVLAEHGPQRAGGQLEPGAPAVGRVRQPRPGEHRVHHLQDQVVLVGHVPVQRHRRRAELGRDPAHGQGAQPLGVGHGDRRGHDALGAPRPAIRGRPARAWRQPGPVRRRPVRRRTRW